VPLSAGLEPVLASGVDTWATVAVAIGTIGTVVYALFRDYFVTARRRPKLELRFDPAANDLVIFGTDDGSDTAQVRLRVVNQPGKDTADDVVAMVTELRELDDPGETVAQTRPIGLPLTWSGSSPPLAVASVHPGSERHIDLLHVEWPAGDEPDIAKHWSTDAPLELDLTQGPAGGRHVLEPGTYEISVEVRARNADAIRYTVTVVWDGKWSGRDAMWDHLRVVPPLKAR